MFFSVFNEDGNWFYNPPTKPTEASLELPTTPCWAVGQSQSKAFPFKHHNVWNSDWLIQNETSSLLEIHNQKGCLQCENWLFIDGARTLGAQTLVLRIHELDTSLPNTQYEWRGISCDMKPYWRSILSIMDMLLYARIDLYLVKILGIQNDFPRGRLSHHLPHHRMDAYMSGFCWNRERLRCGPLVIWTQILGKSLMSHEVCDHCHLKCIMLRLR